MSHTSSRLSMLAIVAFAGMPAATEGAEGDGTLGGSSARHTAGVGAGNETILGAAGSVRW